MRWEELGSGRLWLSLQQIDHSFMPVRGGPPQRCLAISIFRVDINLARVDQQPNHSFMPLLGELSLSGLGKQE